MYFVLAVSRIYYLSFDMKRLCDDGDCSRNRNSLVWFYQRCSSRIVASRRKKKDQKEMELEPANTSSWMLL